MITAAHTIGKVVEINVNGILTNPGRSTGWCDYAVTLAHRHHGVRAEKFEHFSGLLTRHIWQDRRARALAALANDYLSFGWVVRMRGHSNGADVICRSLRYLAPGGRIESVQLIAAACPASFERNGLNDALMDGRLARVVLCCSPDDRALWAARITYPLLNLIGNGYGCLGFSGPLNVDDSIEHRVRTVWRPGFDHCDWLTPDNLLATMRMQGSPRMHQRGYGH